MRFRFLLLLIPFFFMSCGSKPVDSTIKKDSPVVAPVKVDSNRKGLVIPRIMDMVRKSAYDDFFLRIADSVYRCSYKGIITSTDTLGNQRSFITNLQAEYLIDRVYFQPMGVNKFLVVWQETDHTGVSSYFALFERGKTKALWRKQVKAPMPGQPVIDSNNVYISTLGMVGKLDVNTGSTIWMHDSLFDPLKLAYKEFERPIVYRSTVCFYDKPIKGKKVKRDSIWIDDKSGKLVR
jgi:hypothetical protein